VRAAFHEHSVVMFAGKARAGEGDKVWLHTRCGLGGNAQQLGGGCALGQRRGVLVGFDHGAEAVLAPGGDDQVGAGADHAGYPHHQRPGQSDHADQVVQVEPAQAGGLVLTHGAELQAAHERQVEHRTRDDRDHEQQTHERQQQLARQPGKHIHMQAQQEQGETPIGRRHFDGFASTGIEHEGVRRVRLRAGGGRHDRDHAVVVVFVPGQVLHGLAGAMGLGFGD